MAVCFAVAGLVTALATQTFTLAWTHSIEKIRWEEDYKVEGDRLRLVEARIRGSGAGMEPPPDSRFDNGVWHYDPHLAPLARLHLQVSPYTDGYSLCVAGRCEPLAARLRLPAATTMVVTVSACSSPAASSRGSRR
ncbi:MAG: DUF1850 domain-containing protein [Caldimonas sp.]